MNRNFEQRFRRKPNNNNNNNNYSHNNNNPTLYSSNKTNNSSGNSNYRFNRRNNYNDNNGGGSNSGIGSGGGGVWKTRDARNRRPNSNNHKRPNYRMNNRQNDGQSNSERWYKVTVPHSAKLESFFVINALQQEGNFKFVPFNYCVAGNAVVFYVQGDDLCHSIKSLSRRITTPEGLKLIIQTEKSSIPIIDITNDFIDKLKVVMSKRYDVNSKFLNLSNLSEEQDFLNIHLYVSLQRINVCKEVVKIIIDNIPDLRTMNLSKNKIQTLEPFKPLTTVCKNLKEIDLSYNNINHSDQLDYLKGLDIETLNIDFNPFKKTLKDKENYIKLMRLRFPKIINLDTFSIPPPICFDVEDLTTLPETKDSYIPEHLKEFVSDFVKKYFTCFDSDDRQSLLDMYYEQANFSFTITRFDQRAKQKQFDMNLLSESRNLLRIRDETSNKLLRKGRVSVISALNNLPKTEHILPSFKIDVPVVQDNFIVLNINGLYKNKRPYNLKSFTRNFLIVSHNETFAIVNDLMSINSPTAENIAFVKNLLKNDPNAQDINFMESMDELCDIGDFNSGVNQMTSGINQMTSGMNQINSPINQQLFDQVSLANQQSTMINNNQINASNNNLMNNNLIAPNMNQAISSTMNPSLNSPINSSNLFVNSATNQMASATTNADQQQELIRRFSAVTGMNFQFSKQCLGENGFDAEKSLVVFKKLNEQNMIPPEAFRN